MEEDIKWVQRASHRTAVLSALGEGGIPLTSTQIKAIAIKSANSIVARDIRRVLHEFRDRKYVRQLNSKAKGNLFRLTESGRQLFSRVFNAAKPKRSPSDIDWELYSYVTIGSTRKAILLQLYKLSKSKSGSAVTIAETRRALKSDYPGISLSMTSRAMREFKWHGLIKAVGSTGKRRSQQYILSAMGQKIVKLLSNSQGQKR